MPVAPSCLLEPIWVEFRALLGGERPEFVPAHPLGCHRPRVSDRTVFEHVDDRPGAGGVAVDGCITKAPCGGERAGPSPVDRRKGGLKRSVATEDYGIPLGIASAGANRHDSPLLAPTLQAAANQLDGACPVTAPVTWTPVTTASPPASYSMTWASPARSPTRARPPPSRPGGAGPWNGPTPR